MMAASSGLHEVLNNVYVGGYVALVDIDTAKLMSNYVILNRIRVLICIFYLAHISSVSCM